MSYGNRNNQISSDFTWQKRTKEIKVIRESNQNNQTQIKRGNHPYLDSQPRENDLHMRMVDGASIARHATAKLRSLFFGVFLLYIYV